LLAGFTSFGTLSKVERVFSISQFGIYNSDCPHPLPQANAIHPVFVLKDKGNLVIPERVYLIDYAAQTVMGYDGQRGPLNIPIDESRTYGFCVFRNGKVFFCDQNQFKTTLAANSKEFKVKALPEGMEQPEEFKKFLDL
jgi:hypothetical protein